MARGPKVLTKGRDPDCVHYEYIDYPLGTCGKCGQVRTYGQITNQFTEAAASGGRANKGKVSPKKGIPRAEFNRLGNNRRPHGSANDASNAWNSGVAKSERMLVKGVDF